MSRHQYAKFLLAGVSATAVLVGAQVASAVEDYTNSDTIGAQFFGVGDIPPNFLNTGSGIISGTSYGVLFDDAFDGEFTNSGDITATGTSGTGVRFSSTFTGNFTNSGNITATGTSGVGVWFNSTFTGDFTNSASGSITGDLGGVWFDDTFDGNFTNSGNITGTGTGTINIGVYFADAFGSDTGSVSNFTNSADITATGTSAYGVFFNSTFTGDFTNSGNISATGTSTGSIGVYFNSTFTGNFTNSGNITGTGTSGTGVYFASAFTGNFTNSADGDISGDSAGMMFDGTFDGNFTNEGSISGYDGVWFAGAFGSDTGSLSTFANSGNITATGTSGFGVRFNAFTGNFTNEGNISATGGIGVHFNSTFDGNFTNSADGDISGDTTGVWFAGAFGSDTGSLSTFANSGNITATGTSGTGVFFNSTFDGNFANGGYFDGDGNFTSTDSGTITGGEYGVYFAGAFGGDTSTVSSFTNSGNITATGTSGIGVYFNSTFDGNFTNSGNITSTGTGASGFGVFFNSTFDGNFTNEGNITTSGTGYGLFVYGDFTGDLINTGNISGTGTETNYIYIGGDFKGSMTQPVGVRVDVGGTANLSNETYSVYVDGFVEDGEQWDAIDAEDLDLTDYNLIDNSFLVSFDEDITSTTLTLTAVVNDNVSDIACGDHGLAQEVEDAIQGSYEEIPDELQPLVDLLFTAGTADEVAATIRDYSPVSGAAHGVLGNSQQFIDQLAGRLRPNNAKNSPGTWGGVIGGIGDFDTCSGYDTITAGEIGGFEGPVNEDIRVGLALAYVYANVDGTKGLLGDETNVNSLGPAFYARYQPNGLGGLYAQSSVAGAYSFIDQVRVALMTGEQFEADYGGYSISGRAEAGYDASLGQVYLTPYTAAGFNFVALDGYSESGSENGLDVSDFDGVFPMLEGGLRAVFVGEQVEFSALAGYRHEFGDEIIRGSASLDSTSFDTNTTMHSVGSGFISALGVNLRSGDAVFGLSYDGLFGEDRFSHIGSMSISFHM